MNNDDSVPQWRSATIVDGGYYDDRGGWEEVFDYGGIRYHTALWPSQDGKVTTRVFLNIKLRFNWEFGP